MGRGAPTTTTWTDSTRWVDHPEGDADHPPPGHDLGVERQGPGQKRAEGRVGRRRGADRVRLRVGHDPDVASLDVEAEIPGGERGRSRSRARRSPTERAGPSASCRLRTGTAPTAGGSKRTLEGERPGRGRRTQACRFLRGQVEGGGEGEDGSPRLERAATLLPNTTRLASGAPRSSRATLGAAG